MQTTPDRRSGATHSAVSRLIRAAAWLTANAPANPQAIGIGAPGLWKAGPAPGTMIFSVPESCLPGDFDPAGDELPEWVNASARGRVPVGWRAPSPEDLDEWLPIGSRTIRHGEVIRQLDLLHAPDRFAIRLPLVAVPADLPEARSAWLARLLAGAAATWRLVRIGHPGALHRSGNGTGRVPGQGRPCPARRARPGRLEGRSRTRQDRRGGHFRAGSLRWLHRGHPSRPGKVRFHSFA